MNCCLRADAEGGAGHTCTSCADLAITLLLWCNTWLRPLASVLQLQPELTCNLWHVQEAEQAADRTAKAAAASQKAVSAAQQDFSSRQ